MTPTDLTLLTILSFLTAYGLVFMLVGKASSAGIRTDMVGRVFGVGWLMTKQVTRRVRLAIYKRLVGRTRRRELVRMAKVKSAQEATELMGNMKGVFMKLGQIMSFATASMPEEAQKTMRSLQTAAPPMAFSVAREVLETELGNDLSLFFRHIDEVPLAAASIGQVHRATLLDGTDVVLKIQYPGVGDAIRNDLKFAGGIVHMVGALFPNADGAAVVDELKARLYEELDYRLELKNQELFRSLWQGHPLIRVPETYPHCSSSRVLCQAYADGLSFYDFLNIATTEEKELATFVLNDFVFDSMHRFQVFNGDPHPGNYLFHTDGSITFLDFGCVKYFDGSFLRQVRRLNTAITVEDYDTFEATIRDLGIVLPGKDLDRDFLWRFFQYHAAPFAKDEVFTFTEAYVSEAKSVMNPKDLRKLTLPPDLLFFNRITFGLNAIFQKLGASANFHQLYQRYLDPERQVPPSIASLGISLPDSFMQADHAPVNRPD